MLKKKVLSLAERLLNALPEGLLKAVWVFFNAVRRGMLRLFPRFGLAVPLIRFCDFVISRSSDNSFTEFELSNICNARCVFCPYPDMLKSGKKFMHMSSDNLKKDIDLIKELKQNLISFTPTTGDTLLHPEWDLFISDVLKSGRIKQAMMFTNAIELDTEGRERFFKLLETPQGRKLSQIYFSLGGPDAESYQALYRVDRFKQVCENIAAFTAALAERKLFPGVYIQVKLAHGKDMKQELAETLFNPGKYPFVYYSFSKSYYKNDAYTRNALIDYRSGVFSDQQKACAYLGKTRFAADGSIWADGCVISELPGDSSLRLGDNSMSWAQIEQKRDALVYGWEHKGDIPLPCRGCTMYRPGNLKIKNI